MDSRGKNLKPVKLKVENKPDSKVSPNTKPDRFGQVHSAEKDFTKGGAPSAQEVNRSHQSADTDASPKSLHHTLGPKRNQAAPGNHIHDGTTSPKLGAMAIGTSGSNPVPAFTLTGSKGGNVALANLITFLRLHFNFNDTTT